MELHVQILLINSDIILVRKLVQLNFSMISCNINTGSWALINDPFRGPGGIMTCIEVTHVLVSAPNACNVFQ